MVHLESTRPLVRTSIHRLLSERRGHTTATPQVEPGALFLRQHLFEGEAEYLLLLRSALGLGLIGLGLGQRRWSRRLWGRHQSASQGPTPLSHACGEGARLGPVGAAPRRTGVNWDLKGVPLSLARAAPTFRPIITPRLSPEPHGSAGAGGRAGRCGSRLRLRVRVRVRVGVRAASSMRPLLGLLLLDVVRGAARVELELAAVAHQVARLLVRGQRTQPVLLLAMHVRLPRDRGE